MNARDLFHQWANGATKGTSGNVSIQGNTVYSYSAPIGIRAGQLEDGQQLTVLNSRGYSVTTSKHQSWARGAVHGVSFAVPLDRNRDLQYIVPDLCTYLEQEQKEGTKAVLTLRGSRQRADGMQRCNDAAHAARFLPIALKNLGHKVGLSEASRLRKVATWTLPTSETFAAKLKKEAAKEAARLRKAKAARIQEQKDKLAQWKAGERIYMNFEAIALREKDGTVETSQGATVPTDAARAMWTAWTDGKGADLVGAEIGRYVVKAVTDAAITIGCHVIPREAAADLAARLQW